MRHYLSLSALLFLLSHSASAAKECRVHLGAKPAPPQQALRGQLQSVGPPNPATTAIARRQVQPSPVVQPQPVVTNSVPELATSGIISPLAGTLSQPVASAVPQSATNGGPGPVASPTSVPDPARVDGPPAETRNGTIMSVPNDTSGKCTAVSSFFSEEPEFVGATGNCLCTFYNGDGCTVSIEQSAPVIMWDVIRPVRGVRSYSCVHKDTECRIATFKENDDLKTQITQWKTKNVNETLPEGMLVKNEITLGDDMPAKRGQCNPINDNDGEKIYGWKAYNFCSCQVYATANCAEKVAFNGMWNEYGEGVSGAVKKEWDPMSYRCS